jgi:hypothetical protein
MSHRLEPIEGQAYLDPEEVARRLADEFAYCDVDAAQGADDVGDMLAKLIELQAPQAVIDEVAASRERALRITIADNSASDDYLRFIVRPNDGLLIGYHSAQHEAATKPLLDRCAAALSYEIVLV